MIACVVMAAEAIGSMAPKRLRKDLPDVGVTEDGTGRDVGGACPGLLESRRMS